VWRRSGLAPAGGPGAMGLVTGRATNGASGSGSDDRAVRQGPDAASDWNGGGMYADSQRDNVTMSAKPPNAAANRFQLHGRPPSPPRVQKATTPQPSREWSGLGALAKLV
jgi:hypothetical protein